MSVAGAPVRVEAVDAAAGRALRMAVLRPQEHQGGAMYPLEEDPTTLHFAGLAAGGEVLAVGSVMPEAHPHRPRPGDWRIRGMATRAQDRGKGLGTSVLGAIEGAVREAGGARLWCNARVGAAAFYARAGFQIEGEEYEIEGIGPHFLMSRPIG